MKRWLLPALVLLALEGTPLRANGFGLVRRPVEVRSGYYVPSTFYVPIASAPIALPISPIGVMPAQPVFLTPFAVPFSAPPSTTAEPPLSPRPGPSGTSTSLRVGESFYQLLPGPVRMEKEGDSDRCSVAFWNLTSQTLTLRINGRDVSLTPGKSATMELPPTFAWQIMGREGEATRIPGGRATAEVLIRR